MINIRKTNKAFTLAEVLITLVIIGVIAAMTVPTLLTNTQGHEFRTAFKKAISTSNQALTVNKALDGLTAQDFTTADEVVDNIFKTKMNVIEGSSSFTNSCCSGGSVFTTQDGMIFCVTNWNSANSDVPDSDCNQFNTTPCALDKTKPNLWIDVNGAKKPNTITTSEKRPKDIYQALIYAQRIVPYDIPSQEVMYLDHYSNKEFASQETPSEES